MHESCKEEFSDWPNGLLAIGTFGNNTINPKQYSDDLEEQVEETELRVDASLDSSTPSSEKENLSVEQLLDCLRRGGGDAHLESQSSVVQRGGRSDIQSDKKSRGIGKSSLSFLIKKALLCGAGFAAAAPPPPIIRDPLPYSKLDRSTMEKVRTPTSISTTTFFNSKLKKLGEIHSCMSIHRFSILYFIYYKIK